MYVYCERLYLLYDNKWEIEGSGYSTYVVIFADFIFIL